MRVLIADDEDISRLRLETVLIKWGYDVVAVDNGTAAWEVLQRENAPRLAVLDWMMPGIDGIDLCKKMRASQLGNYTYILLLTSKDGMENVVAGMDAGADDYLSKPFEAQEMRVRIRAGQRILEMQETLRIQATRDALTGTWNRGAIIDLLERDLSRAGRCGSSIGIILIDVDHFKHVNDTYGHQTGDIVLKEVARRMSKSLRQSDAVGRYDALGRYGGEEFLVILPDCQINGVEIVAERLRQGVALTPVFAAGYEISVTISLGATATEGKNTQQVEPLLRLADVALYEAKRQGRNRVVRNTNEISGNGASQSSLGSNERVGSKAEV